MKMRNNITRFFATVIVWSFALGISAIALGLVVRGVLSVWSFIF